MDKSLGFGAFGQAGQAMKVTDDVVRNVAELTRLGIREEDLAATGAKMSEILDFVEQMQAVDTEGVEPMANPMDARQRLRPDVVTETDHTEAYQAVAPETERQLYLVPRVVE